LAAAKACVPRITARAEGRPIQELAVGKQISNPGAVQILVK
jgi:hypothetical protein